MATVHTDKPEGRPADHDQEPARPLPRRLYRSREDRMLTGLAGGLGHYFNVDPVLIRLAWVLLGLSGVGILAYIVLAIVVPEQPTGQAEAPITGGIGGGRGAELVGLALVGLGLLVLAGNLRLFDWGIFLPLALVALGVALLLGRGRASAD